MILNRNFYKKVNFLKAMWVNRRLARFKNEKVYKMFKFNPLAYEELKVLSDKTLLKVPVFIGNKSDLVNLKESSILESLCPTKALKITPDVVSIDDKACTVCGDCLEFAPPGLLGSKIKIR